VKRLSLSALAALILTTALGTALARGQGDPPAKDEKTTAPKSQPLTDESLLTMLENMGYTPTAADLIGGGKRYSTRMEHNNITYSVRAALSNDKKKLWLDIPLGGFPKDTAIDSQRLLKLLELNVNLGPTFFSYNKGQNNLYINLPVENQGITPGVLRQQIQWLLQDAGDTKDHWMVKDWSAPVTSGGGDQGK
jgi:hypothetical protein